MSNELKRQGDAQEIGPFAPKVENDTHAEAITKNLRGIARNIENLESLAGIEQSFRYNLRTANVGFTLEPELAARVHTGEITLSELLQFHKLDDERILQRDHRTAEAILILNARTALLTNLLPRGGETLFAFPISALYGLYEKQEKESFKRRMGSAGWGFIQNVSLSTHEVRVEWQNEPLHKLKFYLRLMTRLPNWIYVVDFQTVQENNGTGLNESLEYVHRDRFKNYQGWDKWIQSQASTYLLPP